MTLIVELTDVDVKDAGEKFAGKMHNVSAKMTLKDGVTIVHEQTFSEPHKDIYLMPETMGKIRIQMAEVKAKIEAELALKVQAETELPTMLTELNKVEAK